MTRQTHWPAFRANLPQEPLIGITRSITACVLVALIILLAVLDSALAAEVTVVTAAESSSVERLAAQDLIAVLNRLYPNDRFVFAAGLPAKGQAILVGCATHPVIRQLAGGGGPSAPESFEVRRVSRAPGELGLIVGADPRGAAYGVYALLEALGCGFFLSGGTQPAPGATAFSFDGWALTNAPLVPERLVFNWHNFLSGCSTWDLKDWQSWTRQSQKMGFNAIMVHAYGNNPMAGFALNGQQKPLGFLSTTLKGRDWSTMHVNDVRRLWGGEVFSTPAFGSEAGLVPDNQRGEAAQQLMRDVFDYAGQRAMNVYLALDVDTASANPQELILTLPEAARFSINATPEATMKQADGRLWLANPDTREGFEFYRAQVDALLKAYPKFNCLVVWFRNQSTPWTGFKVSEMPARWQEEYGAELAKTPAAAQYWKAHNIFALGKIVSAFERALRNAGRSDVQLALGTWRFDFLPAADRFLPRHVKLIGLDYDVIQGRSELRDAGSRRALREVGAHRPVIPVVWAQHDDGQYLGRPYTPFTNFHSRLADANAAGFGIIHWTTRPLDLFFTSLIDQVWLARRDQPLRATCDDSAERLFGRTARGSMGEYLERWMTGAPQFGRETGDFLMDRPLKDGDGVIAGCRERLKLIDQINTADLTREQRDRLAYFDGLEKFIIGFHEAQAAFERSQALLNAGDLPGARAALRSCAPERVIEQFARFSSLGGMTRGEQGLVVTLNTRWFTHIVRLRQALGEEAVRVNFAPTQHEKLAQSPGRFTFHFSPDRKVWECRGTQETGADGFTVAGDVNITTDGNVPDSWKEIARTGIESDRAITFALRPIMARDGGNNAKSLPLPAGHYRLRLLLLDPASTAAGQRVFDVSVKSFREAEASLLARERLDIFERAGGANRLIERSYPVSLPGPGAVEVTLTPVKGKALIAGAVLEAISSSGDAQPERSAIDHAPGTFPLAGSEMIRRGKLVALNAAGAAQVNPLTALPTFRYHGIVLSADDLKYRPHDDVIYPTLLRMDQRVAKPLGRYYMYYAPHDTPGGICLAYSDAPEGPWQEYTNNPVISRDWSPHYRVSHVSGPDAIWNEEAGQVFLYFHGENNVTRLASSRDGIHFAYEAAVITTGMFEEQVTEASYGRVFPHTLSRKDNRYLMLLMGNKQNTRRIYLAWSKDGRKWETRRTPFMDPPPGTDQVAGAIYFPWRGHHYLIAHANNSKARFNEGFDLYLAETDAEFQHVTQLGKFLDRTFVSPTNPAVMSPTVLADNGQLYLFFNVGARLQNKIALAIAGIIDPVGKEENRTVNLEPATAAAQTVFDLARIRREAHAYAEALLIPGQPYGSYRHPRDTNSTLYATCDVAILRTIMGDDLQHSLTPAQRAEWINHINSFARADGTYGPALGTHSREHANGMVIGALGALGGRQKYPVRLYDAFDSVDELEPWLEKMDWRNLWGGSHLFWGGLHCFSFSRRCTPEWRAKVFTWLDRNVDAQTGWWRAGAEPGRPGIDGLGGGAHIWPIYQHHGHRFPQPERVIDSILAMQKPDGSWLDYGGYLELDALYGLTCLRSLAPGYRPNDIVRAARRHGQGLVERWPGFLERKPNLHTLLAATGSFGLLNQLLPAEYPDTVRWTDIFSDPQLYRTGSVEVLE